MINFVEAKYAEYQLTCKFKTHRGMLRSLLEEEKVKYNVSEPICYKNIQNIVQTRQKRNSLKCMHRGTASPMTLLEPIILEITLQKDRMNQPLPVEEGLHLSNSLIKPGQKIKEDVILYQTKRGQYNINGSKTKTPWMLLGPGYWRGFQT